MSAYGVKGFEPHLSQLLPLLAARWQMLKKLEQNAPVQPQMYAMSHEEIVKAVPEVARSVRSQITKLLSLGMVRATTNTYGDEAWTVTPAGRLASPPVLRYKPDKALIGLPLRSPSQAR